MENICVIQNVENICIYVMCKIKYEILRIIWQWMFLLIVSLSWYYFFY